MLSKTILIILIKWYYIMVSVFDEYNNNVFPGWSLLNPVFRRRCKYAPGPCLLCIAPLLISKFLKQISALKAVK